MSSTNKEKQFFNFATSTIAYPLLKYSHHEHLTLYSGPLYYSTDAVWDTVSTDMQVQ